MLHRLKVKIKTLAQEATFIRKEERKALISRWWLEKHQKAEESSLYSSEYTRLHEHRVVNVRKEQRDSLLAYAYIRNVPFKNVEQNHKLGKSKPNLNNITDMVKRFDRENYLTDKTKLSESINSWMQV